MIKECKELHKLIIDDDDHFIINFNNCEYRFLQFLSANQVQYVFNDFLSDLAFYEKMKCIVTRIIGNDDIAFSFRNDNKEVWFIVSYENYQKEKDFYMIDKLHTDFKVSYTNPQVIKFVRVVQ